MTNPRCSRCGSEDVAWGKTKAGQPILESVIRRPHFIDCPKQPKRPKAKAKAALDFGPGVSEDDRARVLALIAAAEQSPQAVSPGA